MVEKQSGGGKTDEHETEVRLPFKNLPPYAVPPPAASFGGVLVLARHVVGRCRHSSNSSKQLRGVAVLCFLSFPFSPLILTRNYAKS